jgi:O-antigen ligase
VLAFILSSCIFISATGAERVWNYFNRGQSIEGIKSASGRTEIWAFVLKYCVVHPQGMGYVAGFRVLFQQYFSLGSGLNVAAIGSAHNTYLDVLAGGGWLALALYMIILFKIIFIGLRTTGTYAVQSSELDSKVRHAMQCALILLAYCMLYGLGATEFSYPLRCAYYTVYVIIAIILGISARMIVISRNRADIVDGLSG